MPRAARRPAPGKSRSATLRITVRTTDRTMETASHCTVSGSRYLEAAALVRVAGRLAALRAFAADFLAVRPVVVLARLAVAPVARIDFFAVVVVALAPDLAALAVERAPDATARPVSATRLDAAVAPFRTPAARFRAAVDPVGEV